QHAAEILLKAHDELEERVRDRTVQLEATAAQHETAKVAVTNLLHRLVNAQEDERRRIARDLHDHFGQQLTALRLAIERARHGTAGQPGALDQAFALTEQVSRDVEFLSWELRPAVLDELGLGAALPRFVAEWSAHVGI